MHLGPFEGCDKAIPGALFACRKHWFTLKPAQRRKIHAAYSSYIAGEISITDLRDRQKAVLATASARQLFSP